MPDMPERIQVGPHRYTVEATEAAIAKARAGGPGPSLMGQHDSHDLTIVLAPDLPASQQADTLLHELLHAVMAHSGIDAVLTNERDGLDEQVVMAVTALLLDTLQRNPDLVAFLTADAS